MSEDYTEGPASLWQAELITQALEAGQIDESQAVLLGMLYFRANWTTRVIADFRAEMACTWLGREPGYAPFMRKRLKELRELGWFTSTYKQGVKTPYDITMCSASEMRAPQASQARDITATNTLAGQFKGCTVDSTPPKVPETVTGSPSLSPQACGAPLHPDAADLRSAVYNATDGEMLDRLLTPSQIADLLARHTVQEVAYAVGLRVNKVRDRRELHRSLKSFLLDGGIQIELDAVQVETKNNLERANGWFRSLNRAGAETSVERQDRITKVVERYMAELKLFPNLVISGDVGAAIAQQRLQNCK